MSYFHWIAGCILALVWLSRVADAFWGMPKVADISQAAWNRKGAGRSSRISIIVPACNEESDIEQSLTRLLALDYGNYEIIAVDDRSTDRTGKIMDRIAARPEAHSKLKIIHITDLPQGWLGKTHAMWRAANQSSGDWLLFTDADVLFEPDVLGRAMNYAETEAADHVVIFPHMVMKTFGERMMIAFFHTLFVFGHRPWKVADPKTKDFMGVGAFNLVRRHAYEAIGTYQALRMEVLDDMKLGKVIKNAGFAQRNAFGSRLISVRWAKGAAGVVRNLTKNSFAVMSFQWWRTLLCCFAIVFLNVLPFVGTFLAQGWERLPYGLALLSIFAIYLGMSWRSPIPPYYFALHPMSSTLFAYTLVYSMIVALQSGSVVWRGTRYPLDQLKRGLI